MKLAICLLLVTYLCYPPIARASDVGDRQLEEALDRLLATSQSSHEVREPAVTLVTELLAHNRNERQQLRALRTLIQVISRPKETLKDPVYLKLVTDVAVASEHASVEWAALFALAAALEHGWYAGTRLDVFLARLARKSPQPLVRATIVRILKELVTGYNAEAILETIGIIEAGR